MEIFEFVPPVIYSPVEGLEEEKRLKGWKFIANLIEQKKLYDLKNAANKRVKFKDFEDNLYAPVSLIVNRTVLLAKGQRLDPNDLKRRVKRSPLKKSTYTVKALKSSVKNRDDTIDQIVENHIQNIQVNAGLSLA